MIELPGTVRQRFIEAGWEPARRVAVSEAVPPDHPARSVLEALSGLTVRPDRAQGEECAPNDLRFREIPSDFSITQTWNALLDTELIGIADVHGGHGELYIARDGCCFGSSCIHDAFYFEGASFADAVERALLGRRAKPLLRPDQKTVCLYGVEFRADSPGVYWHR